MRAPVRAAAATRLAAPRKFLGKGVAASGHWPPTGFERGVGHRRNHRPALYELCGRRVPACTCVRISSAAGVALVYAQAGGLPVICDVSINSLPMMWTWLLRQPAALNPPLRQQRMRRAAVPVWLTAPLMCSCPTTRGRRRQNATFAENQAATRQVLLSSVQVGRRDRRWAMGAGGADVQTCSAVLRMRSARWQPARTASSERGGRRLRVMTNDGP
jgi:hypothetical protein